MSAVFAAFGIDWRLLLIDSINFGILLLALWYFLYAPLTNMLESRRQKVIKGVEDADEAAHRLAQVETQKGEILGKAGHDADEVLAKARAAAAEKEHAIVAASEARAAAMLKDADLAAKELKNRALEESKQEVAKLVVLGMDRMMKQQGQ